MNNLFAGGVTLAVLPYLILTTTTTTKNLQIRNDRDEPYFTDEETAVDASKWHSEPWGGIQPRPASGQHRGPCFSPPQANK